MTVVEGGVNATDPTIRLYSALAYAFTHMNTKLWQDRLPTMLITLQRHRRAYGYYSPRQFAERAGADETLQGYRRAYGYRDPIARIDESEPAATIPGAVAIPNAVDEIALNPEGFRGRSDTEILGTLVHEMAHGWQTHFGRNPPRYPYHNTEWASEMMRIGLMPSSTALRGGRVTGRNMGHYVMPRGMFQSAAERFIGDGFAIPFDVMRGPEAAAQPPAGGAARAVNGPPRAPRAAASVNKTGYRCGDCDFSVFGKPNLKLRCDTCDAELVCTQPQGGGNA